MAMLASVRCLRRHLPRLPGVTVSRHGRPPVPGRTIGVPMPGGTMGEGTGTGQYPTRRIFATVGTVTVITGTIGWLTAFAPRSSPRTCPAARGPLFVNSLLPARPASLEPFGIQLCKYDD
jgi:hypothetical protein